MSSPKASENLESHASPADEYSCLKLKLLFAWIHAFLEQTATVAGLLHVEIGPVAKLYSRLCDSLCQSLQEVTTQPSKRVDI